jgi:ATPase subunit of ABC transporter with duplicated ATPase domains
MPVIQVDDLAYEHPGGAELFSDLSLRVGDGQHAAMVGANGVGKSTVLRILAGELAPSQGDVRSDAPMQLMHQAVGSSDPDCTVRRLLVDTAPLWLRAAAVDLHRAEADFAETADEANGLAVADAIARWSELGGFDEEARWDDCTSRVLRQSLDEAGARPVRELSGGERKRLVLESMLASDVPILLLDEPDNFLDLTGKRWLERRLAESAKTILFVSHDREMLAASATAIVTIEGLGCWTHPGSFRTYDDARRARIDRLGDAEQRWRDEERRLFRHYKLMKQRASVNDGNAKQANAAESRWRRYVAAGPPEPPPSTARVRMKLTGSRSGKRVLQCYGLELVGLTDPFDLEIFFGDRVAVLGPNGTGKSHFLRMLGGDEAVEHTGEWRTGASVRSGLFQQTDDVASFAGRTLLDVVGDADVSEQAGLAALARYGLARAARREFETLSGGQKARMQVLMLELRGTNLLLLDEPTDNLDLASAEALDAALAEFEGTVLSVTHDRWFMRGFDRYVVFDLDGSVTEPPDLERALAGLTASA